MQQHFTLHWNVLDLVIQVSVHILGLIIPRKRPFVKIDWNLMFSNGRFIAVFDGGFSGCEKPSFLFIDDCLL